MEITLSPQPGYLLAKTLGPLDDSASKTLRAQLHSLIEEGNTRLVLDLSSTPRVTSQGLSDLVRLVSHANAKGGRVVLCGLTPFVAMVLSSTRLDRFFEIASGLEEAAARCTA